MKLFTAAGLRAIDTATVENDGISSIDLMERAASAVAYEIMSRWVPSQRIIILAGPGNNGGDALAVARLLIDQGYSPEILLFNTKNKLSDDCAINRQRLLDMDYPQFIEVQHKLIVPEISKTDVVVDGLFGNGLSSNLRGGYVSLAKMIDESEAFVVAIDVPSGLYPDFNATNILNNVVHANLTLTFQFPRLAFFFRENSRCIGEWKVLNIDLNSEAIRKTPTSYYLIDKAGVKEGLRKRDPFADKNDFGHMLLVAGSLGMGGAAALAAKAALRTGVGVVDIHTPSCCYIPLQVSVPEARVVQDKDSCHTTEIIADKRQTVVIGPGLGQHAATETAIEAFLRQTTAPMVLDADALNCIANLRTPINNIPPGAIITPHVREFDRLFGDHFNDEDRFNRAVDMSKLLKINIVLKGHYTFVFRPDGKVFVNTTGNAGMATAGSGDVLTGIIGALIAQKYRPDVAASMGVFIHGYAGNLAAKRHGEYGLTASDIVDCIGEAIKEIMQ